MEAEHARATGPVFVHLHPSQKTCKKLCKYVFVKVLKL